MTYKTILASKGMPFEGGSVYDFIKGYQHDLVNSAIRLYEHGLKEGNVECDDVYSRKVFSTFYDVLNIEASEGDVAENKQKLNKALESISSFSEAEQNLFWKLRVKSFELARSARKIASLDVNNELHDSYSEKGGYSTDRFEHSFLKFVNDKSRDHLTDKEKFDQLEDYVKNFNERFTNKLSITSHPDGNEACAEHITAFQAVENVLANKSSTSKQLEESLVEFMSVPAVTATRKKTQAEELDVVKPIIENLFKSNRILRKRATEAFKNVAGRDIKFEHPMMEVSLWISGDGDGNANSTKESLQGQYEYLHLAVQQYYEDKLTELSNLVLDEDLSKAIENLKEKISLDEKDRVIFKSDFESELQSIIVKMDDPDISDLADDLLYDVKSFGFSGAKTDIRHDAETFGQTYGRLIDFLHTSDKSPLKGSLMSEDDFADISEEKQRQFILDNYKNESFYEAASLIESGDLIYPDSKGDDSIGLVADRIFQRLKLAAKGNASDPNDPVSKKVIIAENKSVKDILTVMVTSKMAGHKVGEKDSVLEFVSLSESAEDLKKIANEIIEMSKMPEYKEHLKHVGTVTIMLAESDNRRKEGAGAVDLLSDTIRQITTIMEHEDWPEDLDINVNIFLGGGDSDVRGAEYSFYQAAGVIGYNIRRANGETYVQPIFTIQGFQAQNLLSPLDNFLYSMEAHASDMIDEVSLVEGKREKKLNNFESLPKEEYLEREDIARKLEKSYKENARRLFEEKSTNPAIDNMLRSAAWMLVVGSNDSSRNSARNAMDGIIGKVYDKIVGNRTALGQRAITGDTLAKLSGIASLPFLGQDEATADLLKSIREQGLDDNHVYKYSKTYRMHVQTQARHLCQVDYGMMWEIMSEDGKVPSYQDKLKLAAQYVESDKLEAVNTPEVTLAAMEVAANEWAKNIFLLSVENGKEKISEYVREDGSFDLTAAAQSKLGVFSEMIADKSSGAQLERQAAIGMIKEFNANRHDKKVTKQDAGLIKCLGYVLAGARKPITGLLNQIAYFTHDSTRGKTRAVLEGKDPEKINEEIADKMKGVASKLSYPDSLQKLVDVFSSKGSGRSRTIG